MKSADHQETVKVGVKCGLCPHGCVIAEGNSGICKIRRVVDGELKAFGYGKV